MTRVAIDTIGANSGAALAAAAAGRRYWGIPVTMVMPYVDGPVSAWPPEAIAAAAAAGLQVVRITVTGQLGTHGARVKIADEEPGDLTPATAAAWAQASIQAGARFPVIYCDRSGKPEVIGACHALGLSAGRDYGLGVATLDGSFLDLDGTDLRKQAGVIGVQALPASRTGGPWDAWQITDDNWLPPHSVPPWLATAARTAEQLAATLRAHA